MGVELNHTIVLATEPEGSANWLASVLGLPTPQRHGPFSEVETSNGVDLAYMRADGPIVSQHYCFLMTDGEFDDAYARIVELAIPHWADPGRTRADSINKDHRGRGVYFDDPEGHLMEIITHPYIW